MRAADAPVLEALRARLEPRLRALRDGVAATDAILDLAVRRIVMPGGDVVLVRPRDWPTLLEAERALGREAPFWAVTWTSGEALARRVAELAPAGRRVLDLGAGLGLVSIVAARTGADVLAVDRSPEAIAFAAENLALNGVEADAALAGWDDEELPNAGPFDLVTGGDVLYSRRGAETLLPALDRLVAEDGEVWLADPGRAAAEAFLASAGTAWNLRDESLGGGVTLHRLTRSQQPLSDS